MIEVAICKCRNPKCPSKKPVEGWPKAKTVLGNLSQRSVAGHVHLFYQCVWCDQEAKPVEDVSS